MWILQNKETGELIDPRMQDFALSPNDVLPGCDDWDEALGQHSEIDIIDGYAVVQSGDREAAGMGVAEIKTAIESKLSPAAAQYWANTTEKNEFITIAQRNGIEAAVAEIEELVAE